VAFVWNRSVEKLRVEGKVPEALILENLDDFAAFGADIIAEVCHPDISLTHGAKFAEAADYFVGSPTAFANPIVEASLREVAAREGAHGIYVPGGALWGAADIQKMADRGTLKSLRITMKKHPLSLKLVGPLKDVLDAVCTLRAECCAPKAGDM
jgi:aspartate dehydrogenase